MKLLHSVLPLIPAVVLSTRSSTSSSCNVDRVIGGQSINEGSPPFDADWIVSLSMGCGGSWIDQEHILTAAHCFNKNELSWKSYGASKKSEDGTVRLRIFGVRRPKFCF